MWSQDNHQTQSYSGCFLNQENGLATIQVFSDSEFQLIQCLTTDIILAGLDLLPEPTLLNIVCKWIVTSVKPIFIPLRWLRVKDVTVLELMQQ